MSRLLKILLYAIVLFFLFLWLSTIVKSCGSDTSTSTPTETADSVDQSSEETYKEDDFFEDEDETDEESYTDDNDYVDDSEEDQIDYTEIDKVVEDKLNDPDPEENNNRSSNSQNTTVTKGTSNGKYMVIAGSFLIEKNAENMRNRLNNLGYDNASLVVFDLSQYHSVVAARFSTYEAALKVSNELKRRGMDCYVHAQQF